MRLPQLLSIISLIFSLHSLGFCFPRCTFSSDPRLLDRENTGLRANKLADGQLASESPVIAAIPLTKSESRPFSNHYYLSLFDWPGTQITDRFLSFNKQLLGLTLLEYTELFLNQLLRSGIAATLQGRNSGQGKKHKQSGRHTDGEQNLKVSQTYWNEKKKRLKVQLFPKLSSANIQPSILADFLPQLWSTTLAVVVLYLQINCFFRKSV